MDTFGKRFRLALDYRNKGKRKKNADYLSQEKIAIILGTKRQRVCEWLSDIRKPSFKETVKLSKILDVSVVWLITGTNFGYDKETKKIEKKKATEYQELIVKQVKALNDVSALSGIEQSILEIQEILEIDNSKEFDEMKGKKK
ncbi:MAG: helix-turn-helix transcriptional regulator [Thomasclavelia sp.]|nr:helix-turn-helix transcriptional regulator [Thomasclavelia sp.]